MLPTYRRAQRQELAGTVQGQLGRYGQIAAVIVAEECFRAIAGPFDRTSQTARRPGHQRRIRDRSCCGCRNCRRRPWRPRVSWPAPRRACERDPLRAKDPAAARIERDLAANRLVNRKRGSGLHGDSGDARYLCLDADDVGSARANASSVARASPTVPSSATFDACPARCAPRRARPHRPLRTSRRQRPRTPPRRARRPPGQSPGFPQPPARPLADEAHPIEGKWVVRRHEDGLSVAIGQGDVGRTDCETGKS